MNAFDTVMDFTDNEYPVTEGIGNPLRKLWPSLREPSRDSLLL